MKKILYIHHAGVFGGASRSLLELIKAFPENTVEPFLITQKGNTSDYFEKSGIRTLVTKGISQFDNGKYYHYKGLRWFILFREFVFLPYTFSVILKASKEFKNIDIIHVNEIQLIIPAVFAKWVFKKPLVVHSRSLQQSDLNSFRTRMIRNWLRNNAEIIIPIDKAVEASLPPGLRTRVVHNGFNPATLNVDSLAKDGLVKIPVRKMNVGMVGNLIGHKGFDEFIEAANILVAEGYDINFVVVGDRNVKINIIAKLIRIIGLSHNIRDSIIDKIDKYKLNGFFHLLPFTSNLADVYSRFDVLCFPNQTDAIGRPVFEAAYYCKSSIVCLTKIMGDTFIDGETGINITAKSPEHLAECIKYLYDNPSEISRMGLNARELTKSTHDSKKNSLKVLDIYYKILNHDRQI